VSPQDGRVTVFCVCDELGHAAAAGLGDGEGLCLSEAHS
jgi:hypothetical protein